MDALKTVKEVSSGGIVLDQNKQNVLMIQVQNLQGKKVWTFPKGHQEKGETLQQSALREVQEETGWKCTILDLPQGGLVFYQARYFFHHNNKNRVDKHVTWFLMQALEKTGDFDPEEVLQTQWIALGEVPAKVVYESDKKLCQLLQKLFV